MDSVSELEKQKFLDAVAKGDGTTVIEMMRDGDPLALLSLRDEKGETPIHIAARESNPHMVDLLLSSALSSGMDVEYALYVLLDEDLRVGDRPLHTALSSPGEGTVGVINALFSWAYRAGGRKGIYLLLSAKNDNGETPLHYVAMEKKEEIRDLVLLWARGAGKRDLRKALRERNKWGSTPLALSIHSGFMSSSSPIGFSNAKAMLRLIFWAEGLKGVLNHLLLKTPVADLDSSGRIIQRYSHLINIIRKKHMMGVLSELPSWVARRALRNIKAGMPRLRRQKA